MPSSKRARACDNCHSIKIKCDLGSSGGLPPCLRCIRLKRHCTITAPKRQSDRVAELEAQVASLTKLLKLQNLEGASQCCQKSVLADEKHSSQPKSLSGNTKKRKVHHSEWEDHSLEHEQSGRVKLELDLIVTLDDQKAVVSQYKNLTAKTFPLAPIIDDRDFEQLRRDWPILFQAIIYASSYGIVSAEIQDNVAEIIMRNLSSAIFADGQKSLELVQALQIAASWYRAPRHHKRIATFQLIQLAASMAEDQGHGGVNHSASFGYSDAQSHVDSAETRRTWIISYLLCASVSLCTRRVNTITWGAQEDHIVRLLEKSQSDSDHDRLLSQFVRAERLCEQIASSLRFRDFDIVLDFSEPTNKKTIEDLRHLVAEWQLQIPRDLRRPTVEYYSHFVTLISHESVLHTTTNKQSFAAPYIPERLSVVDFPVPTVTKDHISSIYALKEASQALIEVYTSFDVDTLMSLPTLLFAARTAYAQWILAKLYIASTAPGNTYGALLDAESLQVNHYIQKVIESSALISQKDALCTPAKVMGAARRLLEWVNNYQRSQTDSEAAFQPVETAHVPTNIGSASYDETSVFDWADSDLGQDCIDFGLESLFGEIRWDTISTSYIDCGMDISNPLA